MSAKKTRASLVKQLSPGKISQKKEPNQSDFLIVGIGASAGGLETLEVFFNNMPEEPGIAFVIIQHLSPQHKSIMASLLAKHTRMSVREVEDATPLEPNCVYLNPPASNVTVLNRVIYLMEPIKTASINMPID